MSEPSRIRILCIEDHPIFSEGIKAVIGSQVDMQLVGHATTARDGVEAFRRLQPDITLMDLRLPDENGINALKSIRNDFPTARIIVLTSSEGDGGIQHALAAGAAAYMLKSTPRNELLNGIRSVHAGRRYVAAEVAARLAEHLGDESLSDRELQVLSFIRQGFRNKQIAGQLSIAETTVNFHIKNILNKLHANDRTHAVAIAVRRGLLPE